MKKNHRRVAKARRALLTLSLVLVTMMVAVGGTIAWLTDTSEVVKNTFTESDVDISLAETTGTSYQMVPGAKIPKDPKVTVEPNSEACYVFVKIEKSTDKSFDEYMEYVIADGWTELTKDSGIYYRTVDAATAKSGTSFEVLKNNQVTVKTGVTKAMMDALHGEYVNEQGETVASNYPTLTFTAYAIQSQNLTTESMTEIYALAQKK